MPAGDSGRKNFEYDGEPFLPSIFWAIAGQLEIANRSRRDAKERVLIPRYTREEMGRVWSEEDRFQNWLEVEMAATETLAEAGQVPGSAARIRENARVDVPRIDEIEARVRHDVIAFTMAVGETIGDPDSRALAALRPDFERRGGHRAGAADSRSFATDRARRWRNSAKCSSAARANFSTRRKSGARTACTPSPSPLA